MKGSGRAETVWVGLIWKGADVTRVVSIGPGTIGGGGKARTSQVAHDPCTRPLAR